MAAAHHAQRLMSTLPNLTKHACDRAKTAHHAQAVWPCLRSLTALHLHNIRSLEGGHRACPLHTPSRRNQLCGPNGCAAARTRALAPRGSGTTGRSLGADGEGGEGGGGGEGAAAEPSDASSSQCGTATTIASVRAATASSASGRAWSVPSAGVEARWAIVGPVASSDEVTSRSRAA